MKTGAREQTPFGYCISCDNCISCSENHWAVTFDKDGKTCDNYQRVTRRPARWKGDGFDFYRCSLCDEVVESQSNFCPNCGADMR